MKISISKKIALLAGILIVGASLTLGIVSIKLSSDALMAQAENSMLKYAVKCANYIDAEISAHLDVLNQLAGRADTITMDFAVQKAALIGGMNRLGYESMAIVLPNGTAQDIATGAITQVGNKKYIQKALDGETNVSDVFIDKSTKEAILMEAAPIRENGKIVGVLTGRRDAAFLADITNKLGQGKRGYAFILGPDSTVFADRDANAVVDQKNAFDEIKAEGQGGLGGALTALGLHTAGIANYTAGGDARLAAMTPIPNTTWTLGIGDYTSDVLQPVKALRNVILLAALIVVLLGIAAAVFMGHMISKPIKRLRLAADRMAMGEVDIAVSATTKDEVGDLMISFGKIIDNTKNRAEAIERIADGDLSVSVEPRSDKDVLAISMLSVINNLRALVAEAKGLTAAAIGGKLETRGNAEPFKGGFKEIVEGVNSTLDAIIDPLNVAVGYIEKIGKGEIPQKITAEYHGDFNDVKNNINLCIDGLDGLVEGRDILERMGNNNDFSGVVSSGYTGIYAEIASSVNAVTARISHLIEVLGNIALGDLTDLQDLKTIGRRSENDILIPTVIATMENIRLLIDETTILTSAATEGKLDTRADASKFQGEWKHLVGGINNILEEMTKPLRDVTEVMNQMSLGNLHVSVSGSYKGDFDVMAQAANTIAARLGVVVGEITKTISEIADGNLALEHVRDFIGDFKAISDSLNVIVDSLNAVMGDINESAGQVTEGSRQVAEGSMTLSQGSTEQASSVEELTASMTEVAMQTKQNAVNANKANELTTTARDNAAKGNVQMKEMLASMVEINESSKNISKVIKVIDDISFQTNILALNAAVEAARAGLHGKGFAVVAEEVRNLAARSATAAKETTAMIESCINKAQDGTRIAKETAKALEEIVGGVETAAALVGDIANASNEQASAIAQINQGIEQVSQVIENNSATSEESAAASEELSGQAELLKDMVSKFRLRGTLKVLAGTGQKQTGNTASALSNSRSAAKILLADGGFDKY